MTAGWDAGHRGASDALSDAAREQALGAISVLGAQPGWGALLQPACKTAVLAGTGLGVF